MKLVFSYRKEDSEVAILIIIIIIQRLGVRVKRKRKAERKGNRVCPMAARKHAHLTDKRECGGDGCPEQPGCLGCLLRGENRCFCGLSALIASKRTSFKLQLRASFTPPGLIIATCELILFQMS